MSHSQKAILVVSFGTSYEDARKATIERIEEDIRAAFPEYRIYRAWTSRMISLSILKKREQLIIPNVQEAMDAIDLRWNNRSDRPAYSYSGRNRKPYHEGRGTFLSGAF